MKSRQKKAPEKTPKKYAPKVSLAPLSFDQAITGLLAVKPKKKSTAKKG